MLTSHTKLSEFRIKSSLSKAKRANAQKQRKAKKSSVHGVCTVHTSTLGEVEYTYMYTKKDDISLEVR